MQILTLVVLGEVAADDLVDPGPLRGGGVRSAHLAALRPGGGPAGGAGDAGVDGHGWKMEKAEGGEKGLTFTLTCIPLEKHEWR